MKIYDFFSPHIAHQYDFGLYQSSHHGNQCQNLLQKNLSEKNVAEFSEFFSSFRSTVSILFVLRKRNLCSRVLKMISFCLCDKRNQFEQMIS